MVNLWIIYGLYMDNLWIIYGLYMDNLWTIYDNLWIMVHIPSGNDSQSANWKITMLLMGQVTISMAIFHSYVKFPEGIWPNENISHG